MEGSRQWTAFLTRVGAGRTSRVLVKEEGASRAPGLSLRKPCEPWVGEAPPPGSPPNLPAALQGLHQVEVRPPQHLHRPSDLFTQRVLTEHLLCAGCWEVEVKETDPARAPRGFQSAGEAAASKETRSPSAVRAGEQGAGRAGGRPGLPQDGGDSGVHAEGSGQEEGRAWVPGQVRARRGPWERGVSPGQGCHGHPAGSHRCAGRAPRRSWAPRRTPCSSPGNPACPAGGGGGYGATRGHTGPTPHTRRASPRRGAQELTSASRPAGAAPPAPSGNGTLPARLHPEWSSHVPGRCGQAAGHPEGNSHSHNQLPGGQRTRSSTPRRCRPGAHRPGSRAPQAAQAQPASGSPWPLVGFRCSTRSSLNQPLWPWTVPPSLAEARVTGSRRGC